MKKYIKIQIIHSIFPYKNCTNTINNKLLLKQSLPIYSDLVLLIRQTLPQSLHPCRWRGALTNVYFDWVLVADHSQGSSPPGLGPWVPSLGDRHNVTNRRHPFPDPDQTSHSSWTTLPFNINSSGKQQIVCHQKIYINSSAKQIMLDVSSKYQFICKTNHVSSNINSSIRKKIIKCIYKNISSSVKQHHQFICRTYHHRCVIRISTHL